MVLMFHYCILLENGKYRSSSEFNLFSWNHSPLWSGLSVRFQFFHSLMQSLDILKIQSIWSEKIFFEKKTIFINDNHNKESRVGTKKWILTFENDTNSRLELRIVSSKNISRRDGLSSSLKGSTYLIWTLICFFIFVYITSKTLHSVMEITKVQINIFWLKLLYPLQNERPFSPPKFSKNQLHFDGRNGSHWFNLSSPPRKITVNLSKITAKGYLQTN